MTCSCNCTDVDIITGRCRCVSSPITKPCTARFAEAYLAWKNAGRDDPKFHVFVWQCGFAVRAWR